MPGSGESDRLPWVAWLVLGLQIAKCVLCWQLPLFGDEAVYWLESQHPAAAYDDVPGLTPWSIALSTALLGDAALAVRLPGLLASWLMLWALYRAVEPLGGRVAAWRALLLASLPPLLGLSGVMMLPDAWLNLAVVLALLGAQRTLEGAPAGRLWLAAGVLLGALAHYRFALPLAAAGLAVIALPTLRRLLRLDVLGMALAALLVGLMPVLWQVWFEAGRGLGFQFAERHPFRFQPEVLADPLLQALVVSPLLYVLLLWSGWRALRGAPGVAVWSAWALALLLLYWLLGPWVDSERSRFHWPAPAFLALSVPLALWWPELGRRLRAATLALGGLVCAAGTAYLFIVAFAPGQLAGSRLYPDNFVGAPRLAEALQPRLESLPADALLAVDHLLLAAQLEHRFAAEGRPRPVHVLEHPHNRKHGRQHQLRRMGRDARVLDPAGQRVGLIVIEPAALPLRQRAAWLRSFCEDHREARWNGELWMDRGAKRYALYALGDDPVVGCVPPVVGYIDLASGSALRGGQLIGGWAVAGGTGVEGLRLRLDGGQLVELDWPRPLPSLAPILGDTGDPDMPRVGWELRIPDRPSPGGGWLTLEARTTARDWHPVASVRVERVE